jgi:riboflavin synthase alpha subunit
VNLEVDLIARYVARMMETQAQWARSLSQLYFFW